MSCKQYFLKIDDLIRFRYLILTNGWLVRCSIIEISNSPKPSSNTDQYPLWSVVAVFSLGEYQLTAIPDASVSKIMILDIFILN